MGETSEERSGVSGLDLASLVLCVLEIAHLSLAAEITPQHATNPGNRRRGVSWTNPSPGFGGSKMCKKDG